MAFGDCAFAEIDLRINSQTADDPSNRIPRHFDQAVISASGLCRGRHGNLLDSFTALDITRLADIGSPSTQRCGLMPVKSRSLDLPAARPEAPFSPACSRPASFPFCLIRSSPLRVMLSPDRRSVLSL